MKPIGIIGSGLGGLSAACVLAARGYKVTLFERNDWLGGKAAQLRGDGFRFDMGPTILTIPSVLRRIFSRGRRAPGRLSRARADSIRSGAASSRTARCSTSRRIADAMAKTLDAFAPGTDSGRRYREFIDLSERLNGISQRYFF